MIKEIRELKTFEDEKGNKIIYSGHLDKNICIAFKGSNNVIKIDSTARINFLRVGFFCNNGYVEIGNYGSINAEMQMGEDCSIIIGNQCYFTAKSYMTTAEGTHIKIGHACMIASAVTFRTNDSHPIFDVTTGSRVNTSRDISVGEHVWIGEKVTLQKGSDIGDGSVIGISSIVTSRIPNNCIAVGTPAKVVRRDIAWESPHLVYAEPYYKPDASCIRKSKYWNVSEE